MNLDTIGALRTGNDGLRQEKVPPLQKGECTAKRLLRYKLSFADTEKKFSTYFWYKNPEDPFKNVLDEGSIGRGRLCVKEKAAG